MPGVSDILDSVNIHNRSLWGRDDQKDHIIYHGLYVACNVVQCMHVTAY